MNFVRVLLTEDDANTVWDPIRIAFALAVATYLALSVYSVGWQGKAFAMQEFGIGFGGIVAGTGGGLYARKKADA